MAKTEADRNLLNLYAHFRIADKNRKMEVTTQATGYHYAAQSQQPSAYEITYEPLQTLIPQQSP